MEIQFWNPYHAPEKHVRAFASAAGAYARVKWARDGAGSACRFHLVEHTESRTSATTEAHDSVILALLTLDPRATVRTARAVYKGLSDYQRQKGLVT